MIRISDKKWIKSYCNKAFEKENANYIKLVRETQIKIEKSANEHESKIASIKSFQINCEGK